MGVRERQPENRGTHRGLRRVHESSIGRRGRILRQNEDQAAIGAHHAEGGQHNAHTEREPAIVKLKCFLFRIITNKTQNVL